MADLNPDGAAGNAAAATPEKGRRILDHRADSFCALLDDVRRFDLNTLAQ
jgi:creatinine amidohydrolase